MGTSNALFTGLTGLLSNQRRLDVIGNNIANVGTTSFKSSRMLFSTLYAQTRSAGSARACPVEPIRCKSAAVP